ncbi:MAG: 4-hydroxy-tetrahydrodipicolinate reductase [Clostridiaceae bacterium]|nr:4-hydroxy-tetrahydrodipicolinate reductase [Eubacteriales bacterium]NLV48160.1 4-hydroxy-tetrahydrodipicolinate reductase [Clostridiaceae bacterium]
MPTRIFLSGCNGRMGRMIRSIADGQPDLITIAAGSDLNDDPGASFPVYQDPTGCRESFDVIVDFSNPEALTAVRQLALKRGKPMVICTTGLDETARAELIEDAASVPVFMSANMSLGINILIDLARRAVATLYPEFNIEIIEAHHNQKIDAPSGTALMIADQIREQLDGAATYTYDRSQVRRKRDPAEIGIHAIRGGTIVGQHTVLLAGPDETLSIQHTAESRAVFARGALAAARFLSTQKPGFYDMNDVIKASL